jgi:uncharacterized protein YndB with AHSA1/START domain
MKRAIHLEAYYDSPIEEVWHALTDREALAQWLMENDFEARVGHRFRFRTTPMPGWDGTLDCEVLAVEAPHLLRYSWCNARNRVDTIVTWTLAEEGRGTRVILDHVGFSGLRAVLVSELLKRGWKSNLLAVKLPALLARQRDRATAKREEIDS